MASANEIIRTRHAEIAVRESAGRGMPVLMIHGNSSCKEVFDQQLNGPLGETYRLIAMDLPGHGASSDAYDPRATYSMPGYAEVAVEVLGALGVSKAAVFGWSLGGHVAMEMLPRFPGMVGVMITAAPPVSPTMESIQAGHKAHPMMLLVGKEELTAEDKAGYMEWVYGKSGTPAFRAALDRSDGRARRLLFETLFDGRTSDQKALVEQSKVPVGLLNGAEDPIVNTDYVNSLSMKSLWDEHCYVLRGIGHAAFLTNPDTFNPIFGRFLKDMAQRAEREAAAPVSSSGSKVVAA